MRASAVSRVVQRTDRNRLCHRKQVECPSREPLFRKHGCFGELHLTKSGSLFTFLSRTHVNVMPQALPVLNPPAKTCGAPADFAETLAAHGLSLRAAQPETLQVNVGNLCNQ